MTRRLFIAIFTIVCSRFTFAQFSEQVISGNQCWA
jgi:hypothetical protein